MSGGRDFRIIEITNEVITGDIIIIMTTEVADLQRIGSITIRIITIKITYPKKHYLR